MRGLSENFTDIRHLARLLLGRESTMKLKFAVLIATSMLLLSMSIAMADDPDDGDELDATMRLMDDAEAVLPDAVTKPIQLPEHLRVDSAALDKSTKGHQAAENARDNEQRENGLSNAADARDRANDMAEGAKENRENHGRSEDRPEPPNRPDRPNPGGPPG
jgi:hypothetical protein